MLGNADHHAQNIHEVLFKVVGAVVMLKDAGTEMTCRSQRGETANVVWAYINGTRYCFAYQHHPPSIEVRSGSQRGPVVASFDDSDSLEGVVAAMRCL
jgi:hypothetical protein